MDTSLERMLTAQVYSALLDGSRWQAFLDLVAGEVGGAKVQLHGWTEPSGSNFTVTSGYHPEMMQIYRSRMAKLNPWSSRIAQAPVGRVTPSTEMYPEEDLKKTRFYAEWILPQEDIVAGAGVVIGRSPSGSFMFGANIRNRDREEKHPQLIHLMERIAPHLTLAWKLGMSMLEPHARVAVANERATSPRAALILLRPDGTIAFTDEAGEAALEAQEIVRLDHRGRLAMRGPNAQRALESAVTALNLGTGPITLSLRETPGRPVVHFIGIDHDRIAEWPLAALLCIPRRSLLCVLDRPTRSFGAGSARPMGLTTAERQVMDAIVRGVPTAAIAEDRGVSLATVRSQIQAIYSKCGVNNRAALVALALNLRN